MKTVFSNDMCKHVWAQQTQEHGKTNNGSLSFKGTALYSYNTPVANFVDSPRYGKVCLITTESYSVTTNGKHIPSSGIVKQYKYFYVKHIGVEGGRAPYLSSTTNYHLENLKELAISYNKLMLDFARAKKNAESKYEWLIEAHKHATDYAACFIVSFDFAKEMPLPSQEVTKAILEKAKAISQAKAKLTKLKHENDIKLAEHELSLYIADNIPLGYGWNNRANDAQKKRACEHWLSQWRKGVVMTSAGLVYNLPIALRIKGDNIETSRGAEFPVSHAIRAWPIIKAIHDKGAEWHKNGRRIPLGHFEIDCINGEGVVKAGCHTVQYAEIEAIAKQLNLA